MQRSTTLIIKFAVITTAHVVAFAVPATATPVLAESSTSAISELARQARLDGPRQLPVGAPGVTFRLHVDGDPVVGAEVVMTSTTEHLTGVTDQDGRVRLEFVTVGREADFVVDVQHPDIDPLRIGFSIVPDWDSTESAVRSND